MARSNSTGWLADELAAALADRRLGVPDPVAVGVLEGPDAFGRRHVDMVATFVDAGGRVEVKAGFPTRAIHVGPDIYASGLVAADSVSNDVVRRMNSAVTAAFDKQREDPEGGVVQFCERFPETSPETALASWARLEPFVFGAEPVGTMSSQRWTATLEWLSGVHGLPRVSPERVFRPELLTPEPPR